MPILHVIEKGLFPQNLVLLNRETREWESGFWAVADATAARLVGGTILLHSAQDKLSHFGGEILSYRVIEEGENAGRVVFRFRAGPEGTGVRSGPDGWGNEKKIVW